MCERLRWTSPIIEDAHFRDVRTRLARRLHKLIAEYGVPDAVGVRIRLKMTQEMLARMLGATRESVNKELMGLQRAGVLSYSRGYVSPSSIRKNCAAPSSSSDRTTLAAGRHDPCDKGRMPRLASLLATHPKNGSARRIPSLRLAFAATGGHLLLPDGWALVVYFLGNRPERTQEERPR